MSKKERSSGIELLKIIAVLIIVVSHITHTLGTTDNQYIDYVSEYAIELKYATTDIQQFILVIFKHFGALGNLIFFICSAWFLTDSKTASKRKVMLLESDIWTVSVLFLLFFCGFGMHVARSLMIKSLLPTTFMNNWYMTCYMIIYMLHTSLNKLINSMHQYCLLITTIILTVLYIFTGMINYSFFYESDLTVFITVYFIIAYHKKYMKRSADSLKFNIWLLIGGIAGFLGSLLVLNVLGLRIGFLADKVLHWDRNCNPFLIMIALALFNLVRKDNSVRPVINTLARNSFLIYIIHENLLVRTYIRPWIWMKICNGFGHSQIVLWCILYSVVLFIVSALLSLIYSMLLQAHVHRAGLSVYEFGKEKLNRLADFIIKYD